MNRKQRRTQKSQALKVSKDSADYYSNAALFFSEQGKHSDAENAYKHGIKIEPENANLHAALGNSFKDQGKLADATLSYKQAIKLDPDVAEFHVALGNAFKEEQKYKEAIESYQLAIGLKPKLAIAYNNLATALQASGQLDDAEVNYKKALSLDQNYAAAHNNLGALYREKGELKEAQRYSENALSLNSNYAAALNNLGTIFQIQNKNSDAIEFYSRAIAINKNLAEAYVGLASAYKGQGKLEIAKENSKRALAINPNFAEAYHSLASILQDEGNFDGAIENYKLAISKKENFVEAYFNLGVALMNNEDRDESIRFLHKYREMDSSDCYGAALLLAKLGVGEIPDRASDAQMQKLYTNRAHIWDNVVTSASSYRGHELVADALKQNYSTENSLIILDAGCGTGLVGPLVRGLAKQLDGVDLSAPMLEKAKEKHVYDHLYLQDLIKVFQENEDVYDAIVSAATLIHFGDLNPVFMAATTTLKSNGSFIFTLFPYEGVERIEYTVATMPGFAEGGCFVHSPRYVRRVAEKCGFFVEQMKTDIHEYTKGTQTEGMIVTLRKITTS